MAYLRCAFATRRHPSLCLCYASPRLAFASRCHPSRCLCSDSPLHCLAYLSYAFAPICLALPLLSVQSWLCLCSGSPCRRGSVLGLAMLCLRRAAPCVVWLFNAVACRSKSHLIYAMPPQSTPSLSTSIALLWFALVCFAAANRYSANQRPCRT